MAPLSTLRSLLRTSISDSPLEFLPSWASLASLPRTSLPQRYRLGMLVSLSGPSVVAKPSLTMTSSLALELAPTLPLVMSSSQLRSIALWKLLGPMWTSSCRTTPLPPPSTPTTPTQHSSMPRLSSWASGCADVAFAAPTFPQSMYQRRAKLPSLRTCRLISALFVFPSSRRTLVCVASQHAPTPTACSGPPAPKHATGTSLQSGSPLMSATLSFRRATSSPAPGPYPTAHPHQESQGRVCGRVPHVWAGWATTGLLPQRCCGRTGPPPTGSPSPGHCGWCPWSWQGEGQAFRVLCSHWCRPPPHLSPSFLPCIEPQP